MSIASRFRALRASRPALLLFTALALAAPGEARTTGEVPLVFEAPPALAGAAADLRYLPADRWDPILELVGLDAPGRDDAALAPIRVLLVPEDHPLARRTPRWVTGFAVAEENAVVLLPERVVSYPDDSLAALLTHEVTHVLLSRAARGRPLPRWFQEGVALLASRERQLADQQRLLLGGLSGVPPSTAALDRAFDGEGYGVETAYAIAGTLLQDLAEEHGRGAVARIAAEVGAGRSFPEAFRGATGASLGSFEEGFWRRFRWRYRWVPFLTSGATLWLAITLLALVAIARRRRRDAAIRRRWDEEEAQAAAAASGGPGPPGDDDARKLVSPWGPH